MTAGSTEAEVVTANLRRELAEASADDLVKSQEMARVSRLTVYENASTGEITYVDPDSGEVYNPVAATASMNAASQAQPVEAPAVDAEVAYRRARLGVVAVIVLVFLWLWIRERRSR